MIFRDQITAMQQQRIERLEAIIEVMLANAIRQDDQLEAIKQCVIPDLDALRADARREKAKPKMRIVDGEEDQ